MRIKAASGQTLFAGIVFPFWPISMIRRVIAKLEKEGLLIAGNFNRICIDQSTCSERADELVNLNKAILESTSKTNTDIKNRNRRCAGQ